MCPEDESVILSSFYSSIAALSVKQGVGFSYIHAQYSNHVLASSNGYLPRFYGIRLRLFLPFPAVQTMER